MSNISRQTWLHQNTERTAFSPPTRNVWQTYFSNLTGWKNVHYYKFSQANDEVADKTCQIRVTIDGVTYTSASTPIGSGVDQYMFRGDEPPPASNALRWQNTWAMLLRFDSLPTESILIEMIITSVLGTNQIMYGNTTYSTFQAF